MNTNTATLATIMLKSGCLAVINHEPTEQYCRQILIELKNSNYLSSSMITLSLLNDSFSKFPDLLLYLEALKTAILTDEQNKIIVSAVDILTLLKTQLNAQKMNKDPNINFSLLAFLVTNINDMIAQLVSPSFSQKFEREIKQLRHSISSGQVLHSVVLNSVIDQFEQEMQSFISNKQKFLV